MASRDLILAIDQGTSATKSLLVDAAGRVVASGVAPVGQSHPRPGWVEQSASEILTSVRLAVAECFHRAGDADLPSRVLGVGLSTQRESVVLWERSTGQPVAPMLSWQDRRTADRMDDLGAHGIADLVRSVSGLPLDPMFSALKAAWLLDQYDPDRTLSRRGEFCLGTVDAWLLARLCGAHLTEVGNASRTQLLDVAGRQWDSRLLEIFNVPEQVLPRVAPSTGPFGVLADLSPLPSGTPVTGVLGDSHAALYAHGGWRAGYVKATYGTGSSVMAVIERPMDGRLTEELCLTVGWDDGAPAYAVEGNIRASGATLAWLADLVQATPADIAALAATADSAGVVLVPAFTGLGAPHWDPGAVGLISGITLGTTLSNIARAALESIAFQVDDVVRAALPAIGNPTALLVDGGPTQNADLMQLQADTSGCVVRRPSIQNLSAMGAAHLAGLGAGLWTRDALERLERPGEEYRPRPSTPRSIEGRRAWAAAVGRSRWHARTHGLT